MHFTIEKDLKEYSNYFFGPLAQLVEHFPFKEGVIGSNPIRLTRNMKEIIKFYKNKRILVTGATGFKGAWLCSWLLKLGSKVYGIGFTPNKNKNLFYSLSLDKKINLRLFDIRNYKKLDQFIKSSKPSIIFHLAICTLILFKV